MLVVGGRKVLWEGMRVVVSFTTIPSRAHGLGRLFSSLSLQTYSADAYYLWLPRHFGRFPEEELCDIRAPSWVEIVPCDDLGPFTKLGWALREELDDDTIIVTCDDDAYYPSRWLEGLVYGLDEGLSGVGYPRGAVGYRGRALDTLKNGSKYADGLLRYRSSICYESNWVTGPVPVHILCGVWGCAYRRWMFDDRIFDTECYDGQFFTDDIWISGNLARNGVSRWVIPGDGVNPDHELCALDSLWWGINETQGNDAGISYFKEYWK